MSVYDVIAKDLADDDMIWKWGLNHPQPDTSPTEVD